MCIPQIRPGRGQYDQLGQFLNWWNSNRLFLNLKNGTNDLDFVHQVHIIMKVQFFFLFDIATVSGGTSVDKEKRKREESDQGVGDDDDEWFTADEGVFDNQLGRWVISPAMLEKIERRKKEKAADQVKSATKLQLQFDLDEVCMA